MPDALVAHPRLAAIYDDVDHDRSDLDHYEALIAELGATTVLDIGCGTGSLAVRLAQSGLDVVGVDPARASLDVAARKQHAHRVQWVHGDVSTVTQRSIDIAVMTGNVAQVFVDDTNWHTALRATHTSLRPGGYFVFETRDPTARAWETWDTDRTVQHIKTSEGFVDASKEATHVELPLVSFVWTYRFADNEVITSTSTLRFRSRAEIDDSLDTHGFDVIEVREAPDRPGQEWVYIAQRRRDAHSSME